MNFFSKILSLFALFLPTTFMLAQNQTLTLSPVFSENDLPFTIQIEVAEFSLPQGIQSYASAISDEKWLLFGGRTNGLHGFANVGNNFPPSDQNTNVYVVKPSSKKVWQRSLLDGSNLSQEEIDSLSTTASEFFQKGDTLYQVGGYGINTTTGEMGTKNTLSAINVPKMMKWVTNKKHKSLKNAIRQTSDPLLKVTGGFLFQAHDHEPMLLMLGQNFTGLYTTSSNGQYTMQIRPFRIFDDGKKLSIVSENTPTAPTYSDYRRRDLNIVPVIKDGKYAYMAFGGVFTLDSGVWTVPITIYPNGSSYEPNRDDPVTFMQAMNHYNCPSFSLYSSSAKEMYIILPGGISYGYFSDGVFLTDSEIPFINQVTTIKMDKHHHLTQHLMSGEYPFIASTGTNPGNPLLFGAEAQFFPEEEISFFSNGVLKFDTIPKKPTVIGYIVGGIMSTLPNTNSSSDSTSSPYIFKVTLIPKTM